MGQEWPGRKRCLPAEVRSEEHPLMKRKSALIALTCLCLNAGNPPEFPQRVRSTIEFYAHPLTGDSGYATIASKLASQPNSLA